MEADAIEKILGELYRDDMKNLYTSKEFSERLMASFKQFGEVIKEFRTKPEASDRLHVFTDKALALFINHLGKIRAVEPNSLSASQAEFIRGALEGMFSVMGIPSMETKSILIVPPVKPKEPAIDSIVPNDVPVENEVYAVAPSLEKQSESYSFTEKEDGKTPLHSSNPLDGCTLIRITGSTGLAPGNAPLAVSFGKRTEYLRD
ncbi:MAG: hypothetical protein QXW75_00595, partial [Thermoplasmatales archaeon]